MKATGPPEHATPRHYAVESELSAYPCGPASAKIGAAVISEAHWVLYLFAGFLIVNRRSTLPAA